MCGHEYISFSGEQVTRVRFVSDLGELAARLAWAGHDEHCTCVECAYLYRGAQLLTAEYTKENGDHVQAATDRQA